MREDLKNTALNALRDLPTVENVTIRNILENIVNCYIPAENDEDRFLVQELTFFIEGCR